MALEAEAGLAAGLVLAAAVAVRRLTLFHPATLWLAVWATVTTLLALRGLPYRPLSAQALLIIAGWTALFCAGTLLGGRLRGPRRRAQSAARLAAGPRHVERAALLAALIAVVGLAGFLVQLASRFGLRSALVSEITVRLALGAGANAVTIKYVYFAFAAAALAGLAASRAATPRARHGWIALAMAMIAAQYFSTGRANILLAAAMASIAYFLGDPRALSARRVLPVMVAIAAATIAVFIGMGNLLNKSFSGGDIGTYDSVFVRHDRLQPLALPYQYLTAPLPSFDIVRSVTPRTGRGACQTLSPACSIGARLGLPVTPEPSLTGYTGRPSRWNTFTALYGPLVDAGPLLGALIMLAQGALFGALWAWVRSGSASAIAAYPAAGAAVLYSTVENTLLAPHLVGAALIALTLVAAAVCADRLTIHRRRPA